MQRWCSKLRSFAALPKPQPLNPFSSPHQHRLLHSCSNLQHKPFSRSSITLNGHSLSLPSPHSQLFNPTSLMQVRCLTLKQRKRKLKLRRPLTPTVSKVKKFKLKCYSSYKRRFRLMKNGEIRRWKEGKQHNAHLKSKRSKRKGRLPGTVPVAFAKVMKKLGFGS